MAAYFLLPPAGFKSNLPAVENQDDEKESRNILMSVD